MTRRLGLFALVACILGLSIYWLTRRPSSQQRTQPNPHGIVSLSPGITETLFAIGAGANIVGVSDYCTYPPAVRNLPRVGTTMTPNYEAIARLNPKLILGEDAAEARRSELNALAPTKLLPWLTLDDLTASIRTLGAHVGREAQAMQLAAELSRRLSVPEPVNGPRVLLALGHTPGKLDEVWFIRKNSLHGAALHAAGGRNAVTETVRGLPRMPLTRLLEIDPDIIVILVAPKAGEPVVPERYSADYERLEPLRAVKSRHISVIDAPDVLVSGPRILSLADRLQHEIRRLEAL